MWNLSQSQMHSATSVWKIVFNKNGNCKHLNDYDSMLNYTWKTCQ